MAGIPLITGATGFAGRHLLESLLADDLRVHAWSNALGRPVDPALASDARIRWRAVDLLDRASVGAALEAARPAVIYHCAGFADDQRSWQDPVRALRGNVLATHHLLDSACNLALDARVVIPGSALIYRPSSDAISEDSPIGPTSPYGVSKLAQEMTAAESPLPVLLARPFNHAGPRQGPAYVTSAFAKQLAEIEAGISEPILRVGNLDARRDLTDVRDTVRAYRALAEHGQPHRPYNVCSGRAYRIRELLEILLSLARVRVNVEVDPARLRPSDNPVVLGSPARIIQETGWQPAIPIEQTLSDLLAFWRAAVTEEQSARR